MRATLHVVTALWRGTMAEELEGKVQVDIRYCVG